ncbi:MAG TPA: hypothetical protein VIV60_37415, partial [Polyangiaceae bacterium]
MCDKEVIGEHGSGATSRRHSRAATVARVALAVVALTVHFVPSAAVAGSISYAGVVAATPSASHVAAFSMTSGSMERPVCGLAKTTPRPSIDALLIRADCPWTKGTAPPFEQWRWTKRTPEVTALQTFATGGIHDLTRIVKDRDTQLLRLEILQQGHWYPVRADENTGITELSLADRYGMPFATRVTTWSNVSGIIRLRDSYLVRLLHRKVLDEWDEVFAISDAEVPRVGERFEKARSTAMEVTARLRAQCIEQSGVFSPQLLDARRKYARRIRRAASIRSSVHEWEIAAAFGPLATSDLRDALWLLAWLESPPRRLEALRWYLGLRDRDVRGSELLLDELRANANTTQLGDYLASAHDYLRLLPDVTDHIVTDEELQGVSDEDLRWLHLAQWAAQGGYRFSDPVVAAYFAQFSWYAPLPEG